jgi:hypothetical protein
MKTVYLFLFTAICITIAACDNNDKYVDLETGKTVTVEKDSSTGYMINTETKKPVNIYVNTETHDTIYGRTGKVINNHVIKHSDGRFTYGAAADENNSDYKEKVQDDGDIKIKDGDTKIKIEANGDEKVKTK